MEIYQQRCHARGLARILSAMEIFHQLRLRFQLPVSRPTCRESRRALVKGVYAGTLVGFSQLTWSEWDDQLRFSGILRCNSSMKFSRKITWPASCCVEPPAEVAIAKRFRQGQHRTALQPSRSL